MKTYLWIVSASSLVPYPSSLFASSLSEQADVAWKNRDQPGQTEAAIGFWNQAVQAEPDRADLWIALAKAEGRAVRHAKTSTERAVWADQARAAAEKAVEKSTASAEAYAAYGEALGQWANAHKGPHSLFAVRQAVDALNKAVLIKPRYAYAHMLLAEFYRQSPRLFSIGDKEKALKHARLAVDSGPGYAINHLVLARSLLDVGKKEEGIAELQKVLSISAPSDAVPETHADQETALSMLRTMGIVMKEDANAHANPQSPQCGEAAGFCSEEPHP